MKYDKIGKWSVKIMERRVEGTYTSTDEAVKAVERLLNEGYVADEILIITDDKHEDELEDLTLVEVEAVETDEDVSLWDKIKETFSFGNYNAENGANPLIEYGVDEDAAEHFSEALENRETIILLDSTAPANNDQLSTVNEEVLNGNENGSAAEKQASTEEKDYRSTEALSDPGLGGKNHHETAMTGTEETDKEKPSKMPTKEPMKPVSGEEEQYDPTKAQSAREDVQGTSVASSPDKNPTPPAEKETTQDGESLDTLPQLTGDEDSVQVEEGNHVYPDNISTGVVGEDTEPTTSPLNAEPKQEQHPDAHKNIPESDAYYSNKYEDAGGKTIKDDESK